MAVKIQRPNSCGAARDLYLLGKLARFVESVKKILIPKQRPYDVQLIDAFCKGAYGELDYEHEAANQRRFRSPLQTTALLRDVYVPEVRLATRRVLISDWVEGERLSQASQPTIKSSFRATGASSYFVGSWISASTTATRTRATC